MSIYTPKPQRHETQWAANRRYRRFFDAEAKKNEERVRGALDAHIEQMKAMGQAKMALPAAGAFH